MTGSNDSRFLDVIELIPGSSSDEFTGPASPERSGQTYGGQLLAQAVSAAYRTVDDDRRIHSLHALFLRPGAVDSATDWSVERIRDGRSFAARAVTGRQDGKELFRVMASFQVPEDGFGYQAEPGFELDALPAPEEVTTSYVEFCLAHPDVDAADWYGQDRPMDIRYIDPPDPAGGASIDRPQLTWMKLPGELPEDPRVHHAGLAYLADATLVDHVMLPHGYRWHDARLTGASLDHAMWFHRPARADEWLLYHQRVESTGGARGLASGRFYNRDGDLVAGCSQEGLMRWSAGG